MLPTDYATGFYGSPEQRHPFGHGFFLNVNLAFTRSISFDLRGFVDTAGDALLMPKLSVRLLDRLDLSVGALVMLATGSPVTALVSTLPSPAPSTHWSRTRLPSFICIQKLTNIEKICIRLYGHTN